MSLQDRVSLLAPILISVIVQKTWYVAFMGNKKIKWKRGFDTYCAVLSPPRKSVSPIWRSDSNTNNNEVRLRMRGLQKLPFKGCVALCVKSAEVWFDKRSGVWYSEAERHREREKRVRERERWLKWRVPGWREPVRDKAPAKPRPLEQLFLHAAFGLVQWKEAYVWPGATLPPWLTAEDAGWEREKERQKSDRKEREKDRKGERERGRQDGSN